MVPLGYRPEGEPVKIDPILKPGAPWWSRSLAEPTTLSRETLPSAAFATAAIVATFLAGTALTVESGSVVFIALAIVAVASGLLAGVRSARHHIVAAPKYEYDGVPIEGAALDLLADIQNRFAWAKKMFGQVPAGIRWEEVNDDVEVLLWEAAEHAAKMSALAVELAPFSYAEPGSVQDAQRRQLTRVQSDERNHLLDLQRDADGLAREASNAAVAAKIALSRTGSVWDIPIVSPTGAGLAARGTIAAARARLALLAEVWAELDETGAIADAKLAAALEAGPVQALPPMTDRAAPGVARRRRRARR
jgi:hypothetical protein